MEKIQMFQTDDGRYCRLDQIVTIDETRHAVNMRALTLVDGTMVFIREPEFEEYILPHLEILFHTSLLDDVTPLVYGKKRPKEEKRLHTNH